MTDTPAKKKNPDLEETDFWKERRSQYYEDGSAIIFREDGSILLREAIAPYAAQPSTKTSSLENSTRMSVNK
jgi:hypothetical protein|tara:strand:+ start:722 stop:937 length:216 start_codon:yes stop_codon:yes gene_type:complete